MANISKTFPPKFSQNILYPAVYNLDDYEIPNNFDFSAVSNPYFDIQFPGYSVNGTPILTYGKHMFNVYVYQPATETTSQGYEIPGGIPKLKFGTRILFEFKDSSGQILYSDTIPYANPQGFSGYVWIKKDPLRTYDDIKEGTGTLTIVAKTDTNDNNWRNRYNVRITHPINLNLFDNSNVSYKNESPIVFQNNSASLLASTKIVEERVEDGEGDSFTSFAQISCSKLLTYSGQVKSVTTSIIVSGSGQDGYQILGDWTLLSSSFENDIDLEYADGINPQSETFRIEIPTTILQQNGANGNKVRFKLSFKNPINVGATDINNPAEEFFIEYPSYNTFIDFAGSDLLNGTSIQQKIWDTDIISTSEGQYSFADIVYVAPSGSGGQRFRTEVGQAKLKSTGGEGNNFTNPRGPGGTTK